MSLRGIRDAQRLRANLVAGLLSAAVATAAAQPASPAPERYVDRVLESGPQTNGDAGPEDAYDASGWARSLRLDYALGVARGPSESRSHAIGFSGFLDTPSHGGLSLNASLLDQVSSLPGAGTRQRARNTTWRFDQRGMPLEGGWFANHSAGDIQTVLPNLSRGLSRVFLPSVPIAGVAGQYALHEAADFNFSLGRPGVFSGFDVYGFEPSRGRVAAAGGQLRLRGDRGSASRVDAAAQLVRATSVEGSGGAAGANVTSAWTALAWEGLAPWAASLAGSSAVDSIATRPGGARVQASLLHSRDSSSRSATGVWIDAAWRTQRLQNTAGWFHFAPALRWGTTVMPGDLRGGYWRADMVTRQWQLGWSGEVSESTSGKGDRSAYGSLNGRYLVTVRDALGATLAVRTGSSWARSLQLDWDRNAAWGQTHLRASVLKASDGRTLSTGVDHVWPVAAPALLSTSVGWQRLDGRFAPTNIRTWAVLASISPAARFTLDASLHGAHGGRTRALFGNVGVSWQLAPDWSLAARYTHAQGQDPQAAQVVSALTAATTAPVARTEASRALHLILRYENRAGSVTVPLGGSRGAGAGSLDGTVYFDQDNNGRREATEAGVPNVTVVLDGRYVARTDAQGRYSFPAVVAGEHTVQVQADNVPLPWSPLQRDPVKTTVLVRGHTVEDFALQRER